MLAALCAPALTAGRSLPRRRLSGAMGARAFAKPGDRLPDATLLEGQPDFGKAKEVSLLSIFAGKKGVLFGVPGAFTPGCSKARPWPPWAPAWHPHSGGRRPTCPPLWRRRKS